MSDDSTNPDDNVDDAPIPVVSLVYNPGRGQATPGVLGNFKVDLDTYHQAYTAKGVGIAEAERLFKESHPDATDEEVSAAGNTYNSERMAMLETLMSSMKLEWIMGWRHQEERLKIASDAERTRIRKIDATRRAKAEGTDAPTVRKARGRKVTVVPASPEARREATINMFMSRMGMTREQAMDRLRMMDDMRKASEPAAPVVPVVKIEEEPVE